MKTFITSLLLAITLGGGAIAAPAPATIPNNTVAIGKTGAADKIIELNLTKPGATANPKIRWNNSASQLQFSNNGTDYSSFGSGSGITGNLLLNPSWELNTANWTASAGTYTRESGAANIVPPGTGSGSWDADASADTLTSNATTITSGDGISGTNIAGSCTIKCATGTCTHSLQIYDGTNILSTATITSSTTGFARTTINAVAPTSGTISLRLYANANEPIAYVTDCFLGKAEGYNISQISQATLIGSAYFAPTASCVFTRTSTSLGALADTDCPGPTVEFNAGPGTIQTTDANAPIVTVNNLPAGNYLVHFVGANYIGTSSQSAALAISDGTTQSGQAAANSGVNHSPFHITGVFNYGVSGNRSFELFASSAANSFNIGVDDNNKRLYFYIERLPSSSEIAYRADLTNWKVDANIHGANPSLGTSAVSSYTGIENSGLTLVNNAGRNNLTAQIPCSSTNSPSGTTCSSGNESVGVSFTIPQATDVLACASFAWNPSSNASGVVFTAFQVVETPNNAQTISQEGNSRVQGGQNLNGGTSIAMGIPFRVCGNLSFASAGQKTIRLMYEQAVAGTVTGSTIAGDRSASGGQPDIHWEVYPINQAMNFPALVGSVTSNSTGQERIERASTTTCSSTPCTVTQSGSWLTSISRASTGNYTLNIASGIFSSTPVCMITARYGGAGSYPFASVTTTTETATSVNFVTTDDAGTLRDSGLKVLCMGPK